MCAHMTNQRPKRFLHDDGLRLGERVPNYDKENDDSLCAAKLPILLDRLSAFTYSTSPFHHFAINGSCHSETLLDA